MIVSGTAPYLRVVFFETCSREKLGASMEGIVCVGLGLGESELCGVRKLQMGCKESR